MFEHYIIIIIIYIKTWENNECLVQIEQFE